MSGVGSILIFILLFAIGGAYDAKYDEGKYVFSTFVGLAFLAFFGLVLQLLNYFGIE